MRGDGKTTETQVLYCGDAQQASATAPVTGVYRIDVSGTNIAHCSVGGKTLTYEVSGRQTVVLPIEKGTSINASTYGGTIYVCYWT